MARTSTLALVALLATCTPQHGARREAQAPAPEGRVGALVVRAERPRIWLDPARLAWLRAKVAGRSTDEVRTMAGPSAPGLALASLATGDAALCREAIARRPTRFYQRALVYDWCRPHLAPRELEQAAAALATRMRADMADGRLWRSFHNSGHTHAYELALAAIALHGDDPIAETALAFLRPELDDILETLDRVFPDGAWGEGADYARHASHDTLRGLRALETATGQDLLGSSPHLRSVAQFIFYATKPNGLMLPSDDDDYPFVSSWEHRALLLVASRYRDPHAQWFLRRCPFERFALKDDERWEDLLWRDDSIPEEPLDTLPLARIFRGKGLVLARSSWAFGDGVTWLAFSSGDYFGDHVHQDVNAFQLHRSGELAIDSGRYDDDWDFGNDAAAVARSQFFEYYQRTIAHSTMLVRDPAEVFGHGLLNDGGQRHLLWSGAHRNVPEDYAQGRFPSDDGVGTSDWATNPGRWERADITAYVATPDFVFVRGDGTRAYAPSKLASFVRELVFLQPRLVVVFDRVVSTRPEFEKTWLLHTVDEPRMAPDGAWFEVAEGKGRLFGVPILPAPRRLSAFGGPDDAFTVDGVRFRAGPRSALNPSALHYGELPGAWRIEEKPAAPRAEDHFANVMLLGDRAATERPVVEVTQDDASALALTVRWPEGTARVRFAKGPRSATALAFERAGRVVWDAALPDRVVLEDGRR